MAKLTSEQIRELAEFKGEHCISIYLPTHRYGEEVKKGKDSLVFKNSINQVKNKMNEAGLSPRKIEGLIHPFLKLQEDPVFWNNQRDGLGVFGSEDFFETILLKTSVPKIQWVADHLLLTPLIKHLEPDWEFYILALDLNNVAFYHATNTEIEDVTSEHPHLPVKIEEVVSAEDRSAGLQFRTQQAGSGNAIYHGHGGGKEIKKKEIQRFFREINDSLIRFFRSVNKPLILMCQDYLYPIYKEVNDYNNLMDTFIAKHPAGIKSVEIQDQAWELIKPLFYEKRDSKISEFRQVHGTGKSSSDISDIVRYARQGRIDTLFLAKNKDILGYYDQDTDKVIVKEMPWIRKNSLFNDVAIHTFLAGGNVFPLEQSNMPNNQKPANALLRS